MTTDRIDLTRIAAVVTGTAAVALGVLTVSGPTVPDEHWGARGAAVNAVGLIVFTAMTVAVGRLLPLLRLRSWGRGGVWCARVGLGLMALESVASQVHAGNTWGPVFVLGLLLALVGFLLAGVDGLSGDGARWMAPLPFVAMLIGLGAGDHGGFTVLGAAWWGIAMISPSDQPVESGRPVRDAA
jgi:hypothetical protein